MSFLNPEYFGNQIANDSFIWPNSKLKKFNSNITPGSIQTELTDFIQKWPKIKQIPVGYYTNTDDLLSEDEDNIISNHRDCKNCILSVYEVLQKYYLHSSSYSHLYLAYKYV